MKNKKTTAKVDPRSKESRAALAKMVTRLFDFWGLSTEEQLSLLGLAQTSRRSLMQYRKGTPLTDNSDLLDRVANLIVIHRLLRTLFPGRRDLVYKWPTIPNRAFGGMSPVKLIEEKGLAGLMTVKRYLDSEIER